MDSAIIGSIIGALTGAFATGIIAFWLSERQKQRKLIGYRIYSTSLIKFSDPSKKEFRY